MRNYKDYYKILGISSAAETGEIRKVYHHLAFKYHPDRNHGDKLAEEKFKEINEAYQTLSNSGRRARYDEIYRVRTASPTPVTSTPATEKESQRADIHPSMNHWKAQWGNFSIRVENLAKPAHLDVLRSPKKLQIVRHWMNKAGVAKSVVNLLKVFAGIFAFEFMAGYFIFLTYFAYGTAVLVLPLVGFLLGVCFYILAMVINTTTIDAHHRQLRIDHGPIPMLFQRKVAIPSESLKFLFCERRIHNQFYGDQNRFFTTYTFEIRAILTNGDEVCLLNSLDGEEETIYIKQELEKFLHLQLV